MNLEGVNNDGTGAATAVPMKDVRGRDVLVVIVTHTYRVDARGVVEEVEDAPPPRIVDELWPGDAGTASIRRPSLLYDHKPGTDVVLAGHAHARPGAKSVDVTVRVGPIAKTVRAHGLRAWSLSDGGLVPGPARPITEPIPLRWELAWGGFDLSDPERIACDPRNYAGRGVACQPRTLVDGPAAQLELPGEPIRPGAANVPACFAPIHRHWAPRASFIGTCDERWERTRMPLLPEDFDARHHIAVPHDQWSPAPLRGDEPFEILGATPEGAWRFRLPRVHPGFSSFTGGRRTEHRTHLDSIVIDADERTVELAWRAAVPLPPKWELLDDVLVVDKTVV